MNGAYTGPSLIHGPSESLGNALDGSLAHECKAKELGQNAALSCSIWGSFVTQQEIAINLPDSGSLRCDVNWDFMKKFEGLKITEPT